MIKIDKELVQFFKDISQSSYFTRDFFTYSPDINLQAVYCITIRKDIEMLQKANKKYEGKIIELMYACKIRKYHVIKMMYE